MHVPTHVLSGWIVGNALSLRPRERLFCMLAASLPDLDGVGIVFGEETYQRFHHVVGHNVFCGLMLALVFSLASNPRHWLSFAAYVVCFHLHLMMDFYGSGIGWRIYYLWPASSRGFKTGQAWPLTSWQNYLAFALFAAATAWIAWRKQRTPVELLLPRLEAAFRKRFERRPDSRGD